MLPDLNLRSPYTTEEWQAICRALREERKVRQIEHLPRQEQMAIVDRVLTELRGA